MVGEPDNSVGVLFVCLGNICRSPMAEGAFRAAAQRAGLTCTVDSAGTAAYHLGLPPDTRAVTVAYSHGVDITTQVARQLERDDFYRFSHIIALDRANLEGIRARAPRDASARLALLMDAVEGREGEAVADPYYGDVSTFEATWQLINEGVKALIEQLQRETLATRL